MDVTLLKQIYGWTKAGATEDDVIDRLQLQAVPTGYTIHTWTEGLCDHVRIYVEVAFIFL